MRLFELAFACRIYNGQTQFDASQRAFRDRTSGNLNFNDDHHLKELLIWLNAWGCRQFAVKYHAQAAESIRSWAQRWGSELPDRSATLTRLPEEYIKVASEAYVDLSQRMASKRIRNGDSIEVGVGSTGAAKILFAARPKVFPPWDEAIRARLGYNSDASSYCKYLMKAQEQVVQLCSEASKLGVSEEDIPREVGRSRSTLAELLDEYNWVVYTKGFLMPKTDEIGKWYQWSRA